MNSTQMVITGLSFLIIFASGFWLSKQGKPYKVLLLTIHKLISVAVLVFLAVTIFQINGQLAISAGAFTACLVSGLFFVITIAAGGALSTEKPMPGAVRKAHQVTSYLTLISAAAGLYFLTYTP